MRNHQPRPHFSWAVFGQVLASQRFPGALLLAVGTELVQVVVVFYFAPKIERSSELYGVLGVSAVLLVWLYILARLATGAAFLNATLWERRYARME